MSTEGEATLHYGASVPDNVDWDTFEDEVAKCMLGISWAGKLSYKLTTYVGVAIASTSNSEEVDMSSLSPEDKVRIEYMIESLWKKFNLPGEPDVRLRLLVTYE